MGEKESEMAFRINVVTDMEPPGRLDPVDFLISC